MLYVWEIVRITCYMGLGALLMCIFTWKPYDKGYDLGYEEGWNDGYDDCMKYHEYKEISKV